MSPAEPTLSIDRLTLRLPAGYSRRAASIARWLGEELARRPIARRAEISALRVSPAPIPPCLSDRQVAAHIADGIHAGIGDGV